ncbi:hypothetical protein GWN42_00550 [candidate division KSB1 bacterium]|nr:hypothetical protein [candidate division KSB1 bacterium]NIS23966.1 hypothetical protein [candidate division KSB1 bacterium]NIU24619.1 hypothetical protein [candidate division KSB1 bacterium]NIU89210.1 hypothetical protein [candidate division KSB1 bacterium]NIV91313.1 hypothetical protein [candidate division KSB1 bacterium]
MGFRGRQRNDTRWSTIPVNRIFNTSVTANTDLFNNDLQPSADTSTFRLEIAENTGVVLSVRETVGSTTVSMNLNGGTAIDQNSLNKFDIKTRDDASYNFRVDTTTTILKFQIDELLTEVA